ncbi:beta-lactamase superfamily domain-containing protein [Triangularia verruculosa]|uniref:Beta-lactamase superfamily domain-containing protein n=1 Tax=Triangularia verruculosa TaxID=2587418 RepID=A0AAN6XK67_9PEZI|nr:beta-lactamase superfamily domain-containing protein [Triangularia verruculosa]
MGFLGIRYLVNRLGFVASSSTRSFFAYNRAQQQRLLLGYSAPRRSAVFPVSTAVAAATMAAAVGTTAGAAVVMYQSTVSKPVRAEDIPEDAVDIPHHVKDAQGNHVKFRNPYPSAGDPKPTMFQTLRAILTARIQGNLPTPDTSAAQIPCCEPQLSPSRTNTNGNLRATWLGHACYYVEFPSGLRVLFDPVFEDRCAPVQWIGPKRYTQPPCKLADLPVVDAVVISHSHYDHLSYSSIKEIQKNHPNAWFFVGLGLEKWFKSSGVERVTEMDWWEDVKMTLTPEGDTKGGEILAEISCLPCQHSSGRNGLDHDRTLWASWGVKSGGKSVWFGGDTGYRRVPQLPVTQWKDPAADYGPEYESLPKCPQFKQIGERRGPFDLGLIPIGAYHPRWLFSWMHANPYDAVEIFKDTKCKKAMGIHWGTWVLTSEEVEEPPRLLKDALKRSGIEEEGVFGVCKIGETKEF